MPPPPPLTVGSAAQGSRLKEPGAVRLFRCQLPRHNPYYSSEPPAAKDKYPPSLKVRRDAGSPGPEPSALRWEGLTWQGPATLSVEVGQWADCTTCKG
jgi:pre-rRNA-processing protein TSR4